MSLNIHEQVTMEKSIENANGNVLVLGLGLGYYPLMISLKDNVGTITIVENNSDLISYFKDKLLPRFPNKNKITIIEDDAIKYLENNYSNYDYGFFDIYQDVKDGLHLYVSARKVISKTNFKIDFWLERSLIAMYRRIVITVIESEFYKEKIEIEKEYLSIYNAVSKYFEHTTLTNYEQIDNLLKTNLISSLLELI